MQNSYYIDENGQLIDDRVLKDLHTAIELYKKKEKEETLSILKYITNAISKTL